MVTLVSRGPESPFRSRHGSGRSISSLGSHPLGLLNKKVVLECDDDGQVGLLYSFMG